MAMTFGYAESSGGARIFYAWERGEGTPLLIAHAVAHPGASTMLSFEPNLAFNRALAKGASWLMFDRRNTGKSTMTGVPPSFDDMVDDLEAVATLLDSPFDIYGRREGGQLAVALAARRPQAVRRLLLVSTHRYQQDVKRWPEYSQRLARNFHNDPVAAVASHLIFCHPGTVPDVALEAAKRHIEAMPVEVIRSQERTFEGVDLREIGRCVPTPALFLTQEHEIESLALEAASCLPCARVASWNQIGDGTINGAAWRKAWDEMVPPVEPPPAANGVNREFHPQELSHRESEILALVCRGLSNAEIGAALVIAPSTAKRHVANIFAKLGVASRPQAIALAYEMGLVSTPLGSPA